VAKRETHLKDSEPKNILDTKVGKEPQQRSVSLGPFHFLHQKVSLIYIVVVWVYIQTTTRK